MLMKRPKKEKRRFKAWTEVTKRKLLWNFRKRKSRWESKKIRSGILAVCFFVFFTCMTASAAADPQGTDTSIPELPSEYRELTDRLPEEVYEKLPPGLSMEDPEANAEAVKEMSSAGYIFGALRETLGVGLGQSLKLFAKLCGLLVLSSVFAALCSSFGSDSLSGAIRFCSTSAIFAAILYTEYQHLQGIVAFFEKLNSLMLGMIPVTGAVWAMGGNVTTAATGSATLSVFLTVSEQLCASTVIPVSCVFTAFALCNALLPELGMHSMANALRKVYTFGLGLVMTLLLAVLSAQSTICAAADSTGARAAKLVSSTVIPVVGGAVGETLRTVASGVQYLKSVVGISGIVFIFLLLLPTLVSLLLTRLAFLLGTGVADILGCERESRLLGELGGVYGCMTSVVAMTSVMFILALSLFVRTAVAAM